MSKSKALKAKTIILRNLKLASALPSDDHVKRRYLYAAAFTPRAVFPDARGRARACHRRGGARNPRCEPAHAVRGLAVRFWPFSRQSIRRSDARAAAGAARRPREIAGCRLHLARHEYPLRHRR